MHSVSWIESGASHTPAAASNCMGFVRLYMFHHRSFRVDQERPDEGAHHEDTGVDKEWRDPGAFGEENSIYQRGQRCAKQRARAVHDARHGAAKFAAYIP